MCNDFLFWLNGTPRYVVRLPVNIPQTHKEYDVNIICCYFLCVRGTFQHESGAKCIKIEKFISSEMREKKKKTLFIHTTQCRSVSACAHYSSVATQFSFKTIYTEEICFFFFLINP